MHKSKKMRKLIKAAKMGKPYAMYRLGKCYEQGVFGEADTILAAGWISDAADLGCVPAAEWMKDYLFDDSADVQANA